MNTTFHLDTDTRISNQRHAGIVLHGNKILLMQRHFNGVDYWVLPGGHIQKGETPEQVVIREILEETSVEVKNPTLAFEFRDYKKNNFDYYYLCDYVSGTPTLGGEEALKNSPENFYKPQWIDLSEVSNLNVLPKFAKEWVVEAFIT